MPLLSAGLCSSGYSLSIKNTHSKADFLILGIDLILIVHHTSSMSICDIKSDNLVKLLDGLSQLDNEDQERIIGIVDALDFAYEKEVVNAKTNQK